MPLRVEGRAMERPVTVLRVRLHPYSRIRFSCARCTGGQDFPEWQATVPSQARATRPTRRASMRRLLVLGAAAAAACSPCCCWPRPRRDSRHRPSTSAWTLLTGPTAVVGQGDREAVNALVNFWNRGRAFKNRRIQVDILDNASSPSQAVQNVQRFVADPKYVAILGSGNAGAAIATAPLATADPVPAAVATHGARRPASSLRLRRPSDRTAVRLQHGSVPQAPEHPANRAHG